MNILYGIQATGNGHISRSREIIRNLKALGHNVSVILSGRNPSLLWDMDDFHPYKTMKGLTFSTYRGRIKYFQTALNLNPVRFVKDIISVDPSEYDLVITDFEPVTARFARLRNIPSIGIGHQYAFLHTIPIAGENLISSFILRNFAPVDYPFGLHWYHFNQPLLPPIVPNLENDKNVIKEDMILVYLPFEEIPDIVSILKQLHSHRFHIYHSQVAKRRDEDNLHFRAYSRAGFINDLKACNGVITNAGFELVSEALYLGKKIIVKPLAGQMEQVSNALNVRILRLGMTMESLNSHSVSRFLKGPGIKPVDYPDVAYMFAKCIDNGEWIDPEKTIKTAWERIELP